MCSEEILIEVICAGFRMMVRSFPSINGRVGDSIICRRKSKCDGIHVRAKEPHSLEKRKFEKEEKSAKNFENFPSGGHASLLL